MTKRKNFHPIAEFVKIHNFELPLYHHRKTPSEVYWKVSNLFTFNFKEAFSKSILNRKEANSQLRCAC